MQPPLQVVSSPGWKWAEPLTILALGIASFVGWTLYAGPDVNWDFLNYHLYLGLSASGDRLDRDFFAALSSGYLTPYAYWPIAKMIGADWPAKAVGAGLATIQSLVIFVTWYLAKQLFPEDSRKGLILRVSATILAIACPLVLTQVGSSFIDITTAIPCVLGVALLLKAPDLTRYQAVLFIVSGICFGVAAALKLTNALFAVAAFLSVMIVWGGHPGVNWKMLVAFGGAQAVGFAAVYGYWGLQLWREFGNPFFPLFASIFQAPVPAMSGSGPEQAFSFSSIWDGFSRFRAGMHQRFLPISLWDWLLRPLYMIDPVANVYTEVRAPDARFFALFCLAPFAVWGLRTQLRTSRLAVLLLFFMLGWLLWMFVFGNGRYMMPLLLVAGPALVGCAHVCWPRRSLVALSAITIFVCVQVALLWDGTRFRWSEAEWQDRWISAELPPVATERPVTFVTFDVQSVSWLAAFAHPESRFVHPIGQYSVLATGRGSDRLAQILAGSPEIVAVFKYDFFDPKTGKPFPLTPASRKTTAAQNGMRVDFESCVTGKLNELGPVGTASHMINGERVERRGIRGFFFCRAYYAPELKRNFALNPVYESLFDKIEEACPKLFPPKSARTTCAVEVCWREYSSTDTNTIIERNGRVSSHHFGAYDDPVMGTVDELLQDPSKIYCHNDLGRYVPWSPGAKLFSRREPPSGK